jgi:hypothetical protein
MREPRARRPSFPDYGIPEAPEGMRKYDYRPEPGEGWYSLAPRRALAWREEDYPRSATRFDFD